uniref:Putative secreted protein n=1 Tax=Ixodes ricinus TaxID=34613 RepID=A0A6B0U0M6_IXORI
MPNAFAILEFLKKLATVLCHFLLKHVRMPCCQLIPNCWCIPRMSFGVPKQKLPNRPVYTDVGYAVSI